MSLKDDLLRRGYFPENLPPPFTSEEVADFFQQYPRQKEYIENKESPLRAATYNASKRRLSRRIFSTVHPVTAYNTAKFVDEYWEKITKFFSKSKASYSIPVYDNNADPNKHGRALLVNSYFRLEQEKIRRLSSYRYIASTDIARFYHSIYTHSIPWAYHGKVKAKKVRSTDSSDVFFNKADELIRNGQDGQTVGIPVGPDMSRVFAEIIGAAIDEKFQRRADEYEHQILRHVDDIWIGTNSHSDAEMLLTYYREAVREFELDINEYKTGIYSENFSFTDYWLTELSEKLEIAVSISESQAKMRLRSALEYAFQMTVKRNDDGIIKYVLRYIDQNKLSETHWDIIEPFLKRSVVHFGHTIDYVARILAWRYLRKDDLDVDKWIPIMSKLLDSHGRLGNDSEVCWAIYLHQLLKRKIDESIGIRIVENCGPLSLVALLNCVDSRLVSASLLQNAQQRLKTETDSGRYWPVFLEWNTKQWSKHQSVRLKNDVIQKLSDFDAHIYDPGTLPAVFRESKTDDYSDVECAIESRSSIYDNEDEVEDEDEFDDEF